MRVPVRRDRHGGGRNQDQGRDQDVEWRRHPELQGGRDIDGDRQAHPPRIDQAEELAGGRDDGRLDAEPAHGGALLAGLWQNARVVITHALDSWTVGMKTAPLLGAVSVQHANFPTAYCTAVTISKNGRYIPTTMPPTTSPNTTTMIAT